MVVGDFHSSAAAVLCRLKGDMTGPFRQPADVSAFVQVFSIGNHAGGNGFCLHNQHMLSVISVQVIGGCQDSHKGDQEGNMISDLLIILRDQPDACGAGKRQKQQGKREEAPWKLDVADNDADDLNFRQEFPRHQPAHQKNGSGAPGSQVKGSPPVSLTGGRPLHPSPQQGENQQDVGTDQRRPQGGGYHIGEGSAFFHGIKADFHKNLGEQRQGYGKFCKPEAQLLQGDGFRHHVQEGDGKPQVQQNCEKDCLTGSQNAFLFEIGLPQSHWL